MTINGSKMYPGKVALAGAFVAPASPVASAAEVFEMEIAALREHIMALELACARLERALDRHCQLRMKSIGRRHIPSMSEMS